MALVLNSYLIDIVESVAVPQESEEFSEFTLNDEDVALKVQMVTYKVLAQTPDAALQRFFQEEAGVEVYRGEPVDKIVIGFQPDTGKIYDV